MSQASPLRRATVGSSKRVGPTRGFRLLNSLVHLLLLARSLRHRTKGCSHLSVNLCRMGGRVVTNICCVNLFCSLLSTLIFVVLFFSTLKWSVFCSHIHTHTHPHTTHPSAECTKSQCSIPCRSAWFAVEFDSASVKETTRRNAAECLSCTVWVDPVSGMCTRSTRRYSIKWEDVATVNNKKDKKNDFVIYISR